MCQTRRLDPRAEQSWHESKWSSQGHTAIRTVFFNWQVNGEPIPMAINTKENFKDLSVRDFGLGDSDTDDHAPLVSFFESIPFGATKAAAHIPRPALRGEPNATG